MLTPPLALVSNIDISGSNTAMERGLDQGLYTGEGGGQIEIGLVTGAKGIPSLLVLGLIGSDFNESSLGLLEHQY